MYVSKRRPINTLYYFNNEYWVVKQKNEEIRHLANYAPKGPDSICPEHTKNTWRYRNNHKWHLDKTLSVNCIIGKKNKNWSEEINTRSHPKSDKIRKTKKNENNRSKEVKRSHPKSGKNRKTSKKNKNRRSSEEITKSHQKSGKNRKNLKRHDDSDEIVDDSRFSKCGMISWERLRLPKKKRSQRV